MARPTIAINSTGSNTAASGAPSTMAALSGTAASIVAASTTVTLSVDAPDLSGVPVDGSAAIWVDSTEFNGRQWSRITAVDNALKTVTVAVAYGVTESGRNWGIGGKRLSLAGSLLLGRNWAAGWKIDIQTGPQTLTEVFPAIGCASGTVTPELGAPEIFSSSVTKPLITTSTNSINLFNIGGASDPTKFRHLSMSNTAATPGTAGTNGCAICSVSGGSNGLTVIDCDFDGFAVPLAIDGIAVNAIAWATFTQMEIKNSTSDGVRLPMTAQNSLTTFDYCNLHDNTGADIKITGGNSGHVAINKTVLRNSLNGLLSTTAQGTAGNITLRNCTIRDHTGAGVELTGNGFMFACIDGILEGNGDYAIKFAAAEFTDTNGRPPPLIAGNAFFNNTNGTVLNGPAQVDSVTLTATAFVSATNDALNNDPAGGALCRGTAYQPPNSTTLPPADKGAIQTTTAAGVVPVFQPIGVLATGQNKTTATTITTNTAFAINAGQLVVIGLATDNEDTSDGQTNLHTACTVGGTGATKLGEFTNAQGAAGAGVTVSAWAFQATSAVAAATAIVNTLNVGKDAKAVTVFALDLNAAYTVAADGLATLANDAADPGSMSQAGTLNVPQIIFRFIGLEEANATVGTGTPTSGWTLVPGTGTSGGAADSNMSVRGEYKIVVGSGSQTSDPTFVAADCASVLVRIAAKLPGGQAVGGGRLVNGGLIA